MVYSEVETHGISPWDISFFRSSIYRKTDIVDGEYIVCRGRDICDIVDDFFDTNSLYSYIHVSEGETTRKFCSLIDSDR